MKKGKPVKLCKLTMTYLVLSMVMLLLANPSETLLTDVHLQGEDGVFAQENADGDIVLEKVIDPEGGNIVETLYEDEDSRRLPPSGTAGIFIYENALSQTTNVQLTISDEPSQDYPSVAGFENIYPTNEIRYIGPLITLAVPIEGINFNYASEGAMFTASPSYNQGELDVVARRDIRFEVRIYRKDGTFSFYTQRYGRFGLAAIDLDFLQANLGSDLPETLTISIQAVDISDALPNPDDFLPTDQGSGSENQE
jgi:hypothetical protein